MSWDRRIPYLFDRPLPYVGHRLDPEWRDNEPFRAELTFKRFHRGRSATNAVYVKDDDPEWEVQMFLTDLSKLIEYGLAPKHLSSRFEFVKRGSNYGIILIDIV